MKVVKRIELRWTDEQGHEWVYAAKIDAPTIAPADQVQDYALKRLTEGFDEWRRE